MFMSRMWKRLWREDRGQNLTEYSLLLTLICLGSVTALAGYGTALQASYSRVSSVIAATSTSGSGSGSSSKSGKKSGGKKSSGKKSGGKKSGGKKSGGKKSKKK